jgi:TonB-dependent SusC/RagA subfamily outer membrane receptor
MRKILLLLCFFTSIQLHAQQQVQKWNRQMQLANCSVEIKAGQFTASTFIEMEFYNPHEQELEGLYQFELKPGQVITAFQLELNGKYRDGTLEEKWKATNAYNRIVGKRIDPALLTMDYRDHYSLRIYPVPAKGSRKITVTIQQLLTVQDNYLNYLMPLNIPDTLKHFHLLIQTASEGEMPFSQPGIISGRLFNNVGDQYQLQYDEEHLVLKSAIAFSLPLKKRVTLCTHATAEGKFFVLRFQPNTDTIYKINPKELTVFWDASASAEDRNVDKEIAFLQQFVAYHTIRKITIVPFNYKLLDTAIFNLSNVSDSKWKQYLRNIIYDGATQLGCIDLNKNLPEITMLFTDGKNTYGNKIPKTNGALLFCITSSHNPDMQAMRLIVGASGGKVIDLEKTTMVRAIHLCSHAENWLLDITSGSGKVVIEQPLPVKIERSVMINGGGINNTDTLFFKYGNGNIISVVEQVVLPAENNCNEPAIKRIAMLQRFNKMAYGSGWEDVLDFGLEENVVTPNTAYIVLERAEDYMKYNIEAPKDLQEECKILKYVKSNTRTQRMRINQAGDFDIISNVVNAYNELIKKINKDADPIHLNRQDIENINHKEAATPDAANQLQVTDAITGKALGLTGGSNHLDEVVVVGYGAVSKRSVTGAVTYIRGNELASSATVEQALQGRVAGLMITQNSGMPGNAATIVIRGVSSISANRAPLYVLDGMPVSGNINDLININNIESITVLKDAQAGAIYGSRAVNGAIIITSKKARNYYNYYHYKSYRLKDMEDVEYMQEIQAASVKEKLIVYKKLQEEHAAETGFYFDMAQHFFDNGLKAAAVDILMNAAEVGNGAEAVQHSIAWILESWKMFDNVVAIYEQLAADNNHNLSLKRDLAWACYQQGNYQRAVAILYDAIKMNTENREAENLAIKATMLYEMNEIIRAHKTLLDLSAIPATLIKEMSSGLRIVVDKNDGSNAQLSVVEPGGKVISKSDESTKSGSVIYENNYWYYGNGSPFIYQAKQAKAGKYKIRLNYYGAYRSINCPSFVRMKTFKHFGEKSQSIEIENVIMDNQYGDIEIGTVDFK